MKNVMQHKFYEFYEQNGENHLILDGQFLMIQDGCKYCGLIIDIVHLDLLVNFKHNIKQNIINEKYPCITEEEYIIKKLLE